MTTIFTIVLAELVPTLDEVPAGTAYVIDGSLLPRHTLQNLENHDHKPE